MIDIHHHLLYGLDDGARDLETAMKMAEMAVADGITHVVCTPHASGEFAFQPEENAAKLAILRRRMGDRLILGHGCDFHLSYENIEDELQHPFKYSINNGRYLLVEFPDFGIPKQITESFYEMLVAGIIPIITHPERNLTLMQKTEKLADWIRMGCLVQVTAGSLTGRFGKSPQRVARLLLERRWVHVLATDAHNLTSRPPLLREAYDDVMKKYGEEEAERLCVRNPLAIFDGVPLGEQPTPKELDKEPEAAPRRKIFSMFWRKPGSTS